MKDYPLRNYTQARALLEKRNRQGFCRALLRNNVYLEWRDGNAIAVIYHSTDIVTYFPSGIIHLDNGGWFTVTTKENMNRFSPFHVYQRKGVWYVCPDVYITPDSKEFALPDDGFMSLRTPKWASVLEPAGV